MESIPAGRKRRYILSMGNRKKKEAYLAVSCFKGNLWLVWLLIMMCACSVGLAYWQGNFEKLKYIDVWRETEGDGKEDALVKKIALTFDDGPHPYYTEQLLNGLKERGVKATFFVMGKQAEQYPDIIRRMSDEGHLIGNHTYSHLQLNKKNREAFKAELLRTNNIIKDITGEEVQYVRPPYGTWDKKFETELMMFPVLWTIDPLDWSSDNVASIVEKVTVKAEENAVILMHDEYKSTVTAALEIVDILQKQGYEFVTVDEILFD